MFNVTSLGQASADFTILKLQLKEKVEKMSRNLEDMVALLSKIRTRINDFKTRIGEAKTKLASIGSEN